MKHLFVLCCLVSFCWGTVSAQSSAAMVEKIDLELYESMQANPAAYQPVLINLTSQVDLKALDRKLKINGASLHDRKVAVVTNLKEHARHTQKELLQMLRLLPGVDEASIIAYWATNTIQVMATPAAIALISQRTDVETVGAVPIMVKHEATDWQAAPSSPNGHEIGHDRIKAPAMWSLGYTGEGVKVLIIDSGVSGVEPAIDQNYWGIFTSDAEAWYGLAESSSPEDCDASVSHGTHVAGVVCGLDRNTNDTIGVAPNAFWMGSPAIDLDENGNPTPACLGGPTSLQSLQWALDPDGNPNTTDDIPEVINNSWGGPAGSSASCNSGSYNVYRNTITSLETAGVAVIFSAGNLGNNAGTPIPQEIGFPGSIIVDSFNTFTVGAVNGFSPATPRAGFSSRGPTVCNPPVGSPSSLQIKPEVTAPGVSIRSCVQGGYGNLSGTSFSGPMVSGAAALLMEAFPEITGREVLRALYYTAIDLGTPGEDNLYGNGLIDVRAAYDWLVARGNTPFQVPTNPDASLVSIDAPTAGRSCDTVINPVLTVRNNGDVAITSLAIDYEIEGGASGTLNWTGSIAPQNIGQVSLPTLALGTGSYVMTFKIGQSNGQADYIIQESSDTVSFTLLPDNPVTTDAEVPVCATDGDVFLMASGAEPNSKVFWFDAATGGNVEFSGNTYYLASVIPGKIYASAFSEFDLGVADESVGTGTYSNQNTGGLVFDANVPMLLESVSLVSLTSGAQTIELRADDGTVLDSKTVSVTSGTNEVELNFNIPQGTDYFLTLNNSSSGGLFYTFNGINFPFDFNGLATIKGGRLGSVDNQVYYYFYNWKMAYEASCERKEVELKLISDVMITDFTANQSTVGLGGYVQFSDASIPATATSWFWDFGDGTTSTDQNPLHQFPASEGDYQVTFTSFTPAGPTFCGDADTMTIQVRSVLSGDPNLGLRDLSIVPNPSKGIFQLNWEGNWQEPTVELLDILGHSLQTMPVSSARMPATLDLTSYPAGIYYLRVSDAMGSRIQKLIKQ